MLDINNKIHSDVTGRTYKITWASEIVTQAEVGFASTETEGNVYFIKRLLNMRYPLDSSPGSPETKAHRREICDKHYKKYSTLYETIKNGCGETGACVPILDYFREGPFYYTVYRKIKAESLTLEEISKLSEEEKYKLLLCLVQGLLPMHSLGIIHGDLKPENILVQHDGDLWRIRLIDMNDCYYSGEPNEPGSVIGTPDYYSPELTKYNTYEIEDWEDESEMVLVKAMANDLTVKSDIFALGIIFCEFFSGFRPSISDKSIKYINEAVVKHAIVFPETWPTNFSALVNEMLAVDYKKRPNLTQIGDKLKGMIGGSGRLTSPEISFVRLEDNLYNVVISSDYLSAEIYYTIDETVPDKTSAKYNKPFNVKKHTTVKAVSILGKKKSEIVNKRAWVKSGGVKIKSKTPKIIVHGRKIEILPHELSPAGTKIYYTLDDSTPNIESQLYADKLFIGMSVNKVKAIAIEPGDNKLMSSIVEANAYKEKISKPTIHYKNGSVSIEAERGLSIYYTLDESSPTILSLKYEKVFMLPDTSKFHVKAVCVDETGDVSDIVEIQRPNPKIRTKIK